MITVSSTAEAAAEAIKERDRRIVLAVAKAGLHGNSTVEEIAEASGLTARVVREIGAGEPHPAVIRRAVSEVDELIAEDDHRGDRVLALADVAPHAQWWDSEFAFFEDDVRRRSRFIQVQPDVYDVDPAVGWEINYAAGTGEVYARELINRPLSQAVRGVSVRDETNMRDGDQVGRCVLLGRLPTAEFVAATLHAPAQVVARRQGGLAWMYGRINLMNRILRAGFRSATGFGDYADPRGGFVRAWTYLDEVFPDEATLIPPGLRNSEG
ncbi:hypothetical protein ACKAMS_32945 [Rhodococcus sp. 5A-K4]|uniref:hypothetical protein n=1 Tax=Rhodococcus sp. 5A-K4 TaxID=3384442 RepID=UPI0038D4E4B6